MAPAQNQKKREKYIYTNKYFYRSAHFFFLFIGGERIT